MLSGTSRIGGLGVEKQLRWSRVGFALMRPASCIQSMQGDAFPMSKFLRFAVLGCLVAGLALILVLGGAVIAQAADQAFVGVLSLVVEPDVAKDLGLSDEVKG